MGDIPQIWGLSLTEFLIVIGVIFYSLYDVFAKIMWGDAATISCTFQRLCEKDYKVGVIAGILFAHIFLSIYKHIR